MMRTTHPPARHPGSRAARRRDDRGAVLTMVLALMVVGSFALVGLLTFASTLLRNRPPIETRDATFWTAKSAMSMAMTMQREHGPDGCYAATDLIYLNGFTATVTCTPTGNYYGTGRGRLAVITTSNEPTERQFSGNGPAAAVKPLDGDVFVNGGAIDALTADLGVIGTVYTSDHASVQTVVDRYLKDEPAPTPDVAVACSDPAIEAQMQFPNPGVDWSALCQNQPWWEFAGDEDAATGLHDYPELPPLPTYLRPGVPQASIAGCDIYFPGRYETPLVLGPGDHYFPSGVYYFEELITLLPGAVVVAGEGRWDGCAVDAEAAFAPSAPRAHEITGRGSTFVFGGNARLVADDASLHINRRVSTPGTRGTETIAIRTVHFAATPPSTAQPVEIPDDVVYVADVYDGANSACNPALSVTLCIQWAADHTVQPIPSAPIATYTPSTLTPSDEIIDFTQRGANAAENEFITDGYIFVPNARVGLTGDGATDFRLRLTGGIVAAGVELGYDAIPATADDWFIGVLDEPIQRQVDLVATVEAPSGQRTVSRATIEVNIDESYAINGWTVDPNAGTATTAPPTTAPPTTAPPTTAPPTTAPPTTAPPTTAPPCSGAEPDWQGEYWNDSGGSHFVGSPDLVRQDATINFNWGSGSPDPSIGNDDFSVRWTRTVDFPQAGQWEFTMGGDDGTRLYVDGVLVEDDWSDHAYRTRQEVVTLTACTHDIVMEFYENGGSARATLTWTYLGP